MYPRESRYLAAFLFQKLRKHQPRDGIFDGILKKQNYKYVEKRGV
jgi:hypothetical protein